MLRRWRERKNLVKILKKTMSELLALSVPRIRGASLESLYKTNKCVSAENANNSDMGFCKF